MTQQASTLIQQAKMLSTEEQLTIIAQLVQNMQVMAAESGNKTASIDEGEQKTVSQEESESNATDSYSSVMKIVEQFTDNMPDEVLTQLPHDGAEQHDHYIYGTPKI